jgi:Rad3-related DNA helicase
MQHNAIMYVMEAFHQLKEWETTQVQPENDKPDVALEEVVFMEAPVGTGKTYASQYVLI